MTFDELQNEWKSTEDRAIAMIDSESLASVIRSKCRETRRSYIRSTLMGFGLGAVFLCLFLFYAFYLLQEKGIWPWMIVMTWSIVFIPFSFVDYLIRLYRRPAIDESIQSCVRASIFHFDYLIWMSSKFHWWFTLPMALDIAMTALLCWWIGEFSKAAPLFFILMIANVTSIYMTQLKMQRIVNMEWIPIRDELNLLLEHLNR